MTQKKAGTAIATVLIDNDTTRVTEWRFPKRGDNTGWHRHAHDYVVMPMSDGALKLVDAQNTTTRAELQKSAPYFRRAGVEHDVISDNDGEFAFVEVEFLQT